MYTQQHRAKTPEIIRGLKPWWDATIRVVNKNGGISEYDRHNSCREGFLTEARDSFFKTHFGNSLHDMYDGKPVSFSITPSAKKGELKVQDPKSFAINVAKATRPFYVLLFNDEETLAWFKANPSGKYSTTQEGMTTIRLPMRFFYDPELVSLFIGLWRCIYALDGTKYATEFGELVSDTELKAVEAGDVKTARSVAKNVAKYLAGMWNSAHSPINSENLENVNRMIVSKSLSTRFALKKYKTTWTESTKVHSPYHEGSHDKWTKSALEFGFHDNVIRKFEKKVAVPVTPAPGVRKVARK